LGNVTMTAPRLAQISWSLSAIRCTCLP